MPIRRAPLRDVVRVFDVDGPRGGTIYVTVFACGHRLWERRRLLKPTPTRSCVGCYVDAQVDALLEAEAEAATFCPGCEKQIDPEVCHCGEAVASHGSYSGHSPVPLGCDCGRVHD